MKIFFLLIFFISFLDAKIYRKDSSKIVIDDINKLMWVDDISALEVIKTHEEALEYCEKLNHASYSNWRLPLIKEYELIVDKKNNKNYINLAFKYNVPDGYWAFKSHWRTLWFYADYMHFISGTAYFDSRHKKKYVRCVRNF